MENLTEKILIQAGLLKDYKDLLISQHIDCEVWVDITQEHLSAIGISNSHHIKLILTKRDQMLGFTPNSPAIVEEPKIDQPQDLSISYNSVVRAARTQTKNKSDSGVNVLKKVKSLDMSAKSLTTIANLNYCTSLQMLSLSHNSITQIAGLENLRSLRILNLESNLIQAIEGLGALGKLEKLYLDFNYIKRVEGLESLSSIQELWISNQQGQGQMYLDENSIVAISPSLRKLGLAGNNIEDIGLLWYLDGLVELDLSNNNVTFCEDLYKVLSCLRYLQRLKLIGNIVAKRVKYRDEMILWSHNLQELDDKNILANEKEYLFRLKGKRGGDFPKGKASESMELEIKGSRLNNN